MSRKTRTIPYVLLGAAVALAGVVELLRDDRIPDESRDRQTLTELNNEMIRAHVRGDWTNAARVAGKILAQPAWRTFVPANAVMGSALAQEGDYAAAEAFFRAALSGKGAAAPQPVVMNDYADTLRHLKRYDEAESLARRAIAESGGKEVLYKLTLAQVLRDAGKDTGEMEAVLAKYDQFKN